MLALLVLLCIVSLVRGLGVFGLEDATEQGPVHGPRLDGFGAVGAVAVHALLADVDLPAAEIGGGWFHGLGLRVKIIKWDLSAAIRALSLSAFNKSFSEC